jgi:hypothetical protein
MKLPNVKFQGDPSSWIRAHTCTDGHDEVSRCFRDYLNAPKNSEKTRYRKSINTRVTMQGCTVLQYKIHMFITLTRLTFMKSAFHPQCRYAFRRIVTVNSRYFPLNINGLIFVTELRCDLLKTRTEY